MILGDYFFYHEVEGGVLPAIDDEPINSFDSYEKDPIKEELVPVGVTRDELKQAFAKQIEKYVPAGMQLKIKWIFQDVCPASAFWPVLPSVGWRVPVKLDYS